MRFALVKVLGVLCTVLENWITKLVLEDTPFDTAIRYVTDRLR